MDFHFKIKSQNRFVIFYVVIFNFSHFLIFSYGHTIVLKIEFDASKDRHKVKRLFNKPEIQITDKRCNTRITGNQMDLLHIIYPGIMKYFQLNILMCIGAFYIYKRIKVTGLSKSDKALLC